MLRHLGYVGQNLSLGITTSHGTILRNASPERLRLLIRTNLDSLADILAFNETHRIRLYRITSGIIPFASHPINELEWWTEFRGELLSIGERIRRAGMRVGMHPGRYSLLSSPRPEVVEASIRDFQWHARFLDSLGLGTEHKIVLHVGGAYGDKNAAIERMVANYRRLSSSVRRRMILENDERLYTVEEVLEISKQTGLPVVIDWLHHRANPGATKDRVALAERCFATWHAEDGIPEIHFSSQAAGSRPGSHSQYVDPEEFLQMYQELNGLEFDCELEAKAKDLALLRLREQLNWLPLSQ